MSAQHSPSLSDASAAVRLGQLAPLEANEFDALASATNTPRHIPAHREILGAGRPITEPSIILSGWVGRSRIYPHGRRQILSLLLPGDLLGVCRQTRPVATTGMIALTDVTLCPAPPASPDQPGLAEAYARSQAVEEFYLFRHIARIGRLNAHDRMIDFLLETRDRLNAVGLGTADSFPMPLTQDVLADTLGLTSVHINRTLQTLRRDGLLDLSGGIARLKDVDRLVEAIDYRPAAVTAA